MKKKISFLLLLSLLLAGCTGEQPVDMQLTGEPINLVQEEAGDITGENAVPERIYTPPEMKGEITISIMDEMPVLEQAAQIFMEKYPEVTITINQFRELEIIQLEGGAVMAAEPSGEKSGNNYLSQLNTRIMTGNAEDIIMTGSRIPVQKYIQMGALEDLSFYMENAPEINEDAYYMNLFEAVKRSDGHMYELPLMTGVRVMAFHQALADDCGEYLPEDMTKISYEDAMNYALKLMTNTSRKNTYLAISDGKGVVMGILNDRWQEFVNEKTGEVHFDTEEYIHLLELARDMEEKGCFDIAGLDFYNMEYYFAMTEDYDVQAAYYHLLNSVDSQSYYHVMPLSDKEGNVALSGYMQFGINAASPNKDLAWEFLRYMLSDEVQTLPSFYGLAVSKNGFDTYIKRQYDMYNAGNSAGMDFNEYRNLIESWLLQINSYNPGRTDMINIIYEENRAFFDGKKTAAETAGLVQAKMDQYLNE